MGEPLPEPGTGRSLPGLLLTPAQRRRAHRNWRRLLCVPAERALQLARLRDALTLRLESFWSLRGTPALPPSAPQAWILDSGASVHVVGRSQGVTGLPSGRRSTCPRRCAQVSRFLVGLAVRHPAVRRAFTRAALGLLRRRAAIFGRAVIPGVALSFFWQRREVLYALGQEALRLLF